MIRLHYWSTPNGHKTTIFLEESGAAYELHPVDIFRGDQFKPDFLRISPNNRMPAMIDDAPGGGGAPVSIFESGAILLYLAEKTGKFLPGDLHGRFDALQWLFWQTGGLGPMAGQNHHFQGAAPEKIPYAIERYVNETARLYAVLNLRLADRDFIAGNYSIADIASFPWIAFHDRQSLKLADFPNVNRWFQTIKARPGTVRAYARGIQLANQSGIDLATRNILFPGWPQPDETTA